MSDDPKVSDRTQYVVGTLISIVLVTGYLLLSNDRVGSSGPEVNKPPETGGEQVNVVDQNETKQPEVRQ